MTAIAKYLEAAYRRPAVDVTELGHAARNAAHEVRELVERQDKQAQAAAALYQVLGVLIYEAGLFDTDRGQLALTTASWLAGNRDEVPDFDALLPFDVEARA